MKIMTFAELEQQIQRSYQDGTILELPQEVFAGLSQEQAQQLADKYGSKTLLRLPQSERDFFEWLRLQSPEIWADLWENDLLDEDEVYTVGFGMLPELCVHDRGFPICDLQQYQNYYFTIGHIHSEEALPYVEAAQQKMEDNVPLDPAEVFILELRRAPLDVWRFAYNYQLPLKLALKAVHQLLDDGLLLKESLQDTIAEAEAAASLEDLTKFWGTSVDEEMLNDEGDDYLQ